MALRGLSIQLTARERDGTGRDGTKVGKYAKTNRLALALAREEIVVVNRPSNQLYRTVIERQIDTKERRLT